LGRDAPTEPPQVLGRRSQCLLDHLRPPEVAVYGVVEVDTDPAVQVLRRVRDSVTAVAGPELRDVDLVGSGQLLGQPPRRLLRGEPDGLRVDVRVGDALRDRLERPDLGAELLTA